MTDFNWLAVLTAAAAYFLLGSLWYAIWGQTWLRSLGKRAEELNPRDPYPYFVAALGALLNATVMAVILAMARAQTVAEGVAFGFLCGAGIAAATAKKHYAFSGWPFKLFAIDYSLDILGFIALGAILTLWR